WLKQARQKGGVSHEKVQETKGGCQKLLTPHDEILRLRSQQAWRHRHLLQIRILHRTTGSGTIGDGYRHKSGGRRIRWSLHVNLSRADVFHERRLAVDRNRNSADTWI